MFIIRQTYVIQNVNGVIYRLSEFECDSVSDLPTQAQTGWNVMTGSKAHVIDTNSWYAIKSTGAWVLQNSDGTAGYTKEEIDALIQDTKDYADGEILGAINDLDVPAVGGTTRYIYQISEANGLIDAKYYTSDATPTTGSTKLVQSKGVKDYVDAETTARQTECGAIANLGAKNMCPYNTFSCTTAGTTVISDKPINLPAGTYIMSYTQTATTGSSSIRFLNNGTSIVNFTINNDSNLEKTREFTLTSAVNQIRVYSSVVNDYTQVMIRPKAISDSTYVPYAPTNAELNDSKITMLNILGAGTRINATASATLNFNDEPFTSVGRFNWLSTATPYITNCPTYINGVNKGGVLETSFIQGPSTVLQTARASAGADSPTIFWQRFRYGAGTDDNPYRWTSWYAFTGTEVQTPSAQTNLTRSIAKSTEENDFDPIDEPIDEQIEDER